MDQAKLPKEFQTTHWSLVASSREQDSDIRRESLAELYRSYWYPLFAYLRRKGHSPEASADYVQGFFVELIDKDFLRAVAPEKGRFRWFLMSAVGRYVANQKDKLATQKRGGDRQSFSLDLATAEQRYQMEPVDGWTAEKLFDRRWALEVLNAALIELRAQHESAGKLRLYDALSPTLGGQSMTGEQYAEIAAELGMSPVGVKVAAHRLRDKYREALVAIVRQTLADQGGVDDELGALLTALRPEK